VLEGKFWGGSRKQGEKIRGNEGKWDSDSKNGKEKW